MKRYYLSHYFNFKNAGIFMLVSLLRLFLVLTIVLLAAKLKMHFNIRNNDYSHAAIKRINRSHKRKELSIVEGFYEMVFSSTSVLLFLSLYYIIDERIPEAAYFWNKYQDFILLLFIIFSVFFTGILDHVFVKLDELSPEQKSSIRLVSSFYIILILFYIKFIYDDSNYDSLIIYFITLAIGRFLYFDFTLEDFFSTIMGAIRNLPFLLLMGTYSAFVCWFGFHVDFLLTSNGVILSTLLAHIFMDISIFILAKTRILKLIVK